MGHMKILILLLCLASSGCVLRLPNTKFTEYHSDTTIMGFQSVIDATGISATDTRLKAKEVKWNMSWPGFHRTLTFKDFEQERAQEQEKGQKP